MNTVKLRKYLDSVIGTVFKNEDKFIEHFSNFIEGATEIESFYMASERCRIDVLTHGGMIVTTTISTSDVLDWFEAI